MTARFRQILGASLALGALLLPASPATAASQRHGVPPTLVRSSGSWGDDEYITGTYPSRVAVVSHSTEVDMSFTTTVPAIAGGCQLIHRVADPVIECGFRTSPTPVSYWGFYAIFTPDQLRGYGMHTWAASAEFPDPAGGPGVLIQDETNYPMDIRAGSGLVLAANRVGAGSTVSVHVFSAAYNATPDRFAAWGGQGVYLQKKQPNGTWAYAGGLVTDSTGHASRTISSGPGVYRAYLHDAPTIFGAVTAPLSLK